MNSRRNACFFSLAVVLCCLALACGQSDNDIFDGNSSNNNNSGTNTDTSTKAVSSKSDDTIFDSDGDKEDTGGKAPVANNDQTIFDGAKKGVGSPLRAPLDVVVGMGMIGVLSARLLVYQ